MKNILWQRVDWPGHEHLHVEQDADGGNRLTGVAVFLSEQGTCRMDYYVECDQRWRTRRCQVDGWLGERKIETVVEATPDGGWLLNSVPLKDVRDCVDVDLNFSPCTNTLPIRRLQLKVGQSAIVGAAWLRFPEFTLERLEQVYTRTGDLTYRYESRDGAFRRDLAVDAQGIVVDYPGIWRRAIRE